MRVNVNQTATRRRRSADVFPMELAVHFLSQHVDAHLNLTRNLAATDDVPVLVQQSGKMRAYRVETDVSRKHDSQTRSSFQVPYFNKVPYLYRVFALDLTYKEDANKQSIGIKARSQTRFRFL